MRRWSSSVASPARIYPDRARGDRIGRAVAHTDYPGTSGQSGVASLGRGKRRECDKGPKGHGGERLRDGTHQLNSIPGRFATGAPEEGCPMASHHPLASRGGIGEL